ncbi:C4b-binding protein alpha chain-like [Mytilus edulis]|uniref:C4b-binding protein alpha chain-like n=1 Tax=Mytilus edulis TaxID=6550 RepID=UPI0039F00902
MQCHNPGGVANATYTLHGQSEGSTVTYACNTGYMYEAGFLTRTCQSDGTWDGVPPVCTGTCGLPPTYNFTTQSYTGVTSGSIAEFKCNFGYAFTSGSIQHQCFSPNWIGNPVVCKDVLSTKEVTEMINKIEKELTVDKKTTSTFHRRKNCAEDPRPSSKKIGLIGMFIMTVYFCLILILDCIGGGRKE